MAYLCVFAFIRIFFFHFVCIWFRTLLLVCFAVSCKCPRVAECTSTWHSVKSGQNRDSLKSESKNAWKSRSTSNKWQMNRWIFSKFLGLRDFLWFQKLDCTGIRCILLYRLGDPLDLFSRLLPWHTCVETANAFALVKMAHSLQLVGVGIIHSLFTQLIWEKRSKKRNQKKCTSFNWQNKLKLTVCEYMAVACMCPPWDIDGIPCTIYQLVCCARERERGRGRVWFGAVIWLRHQFTLGKMCCGTVCSSPAISLCTQIDDGHWK